VLPISFYDISSNDVKITLKSFKRSFLFASLLFLISFVIGYAVSPLADFSQIEGNLDDVVSMISELSPLEIAIFIFLNNSVKSVLVIILSPLLGIFPIFFLVFNGFLIGLVIYDALTVTSLLVVSSAIIPHGIIELPIIILAGSIGLKIGNESLKRIYRDDSYLVDYFKFGLRISISKIVPGLLIAAILESFLTPVIVNLFL
tara:strand:+ start:1430 stop:2035 length:606 start_codon:yes stop_codon:yes gene_type:complete